MSQRVVFQRLDSVWENQIVKSLALSKLTFVATVLPIPDDFVKSVNKQIAKFIWSQKNPKIKKTTMIGEKKEGG